MQILLVVEITQKPLIQQCIIPLLNDEKASSETFTIAMHAVVGLLHVGLCYAVSSSHVIDDRQPAFWVFFRQTSSVHFRDVFLTLAGNRYYNMVNARACMAH